MGLQEAQGSDNCQRPVAFGLSCRAHGKVESDRTLQPLFTDSMLASVGRVHIGAPTDDAEKCSDAD